MKFPTKRNAVKAIVTVVANASVCKAVEELMVFAGADEDSNTVHHVALGVGTTIYFGRYHANAMNAIDRIADWRIARKEEDSAVTSA